MKFNYTKIATAMLVSVGVTACGGGGGSSGDNNNNNNNDSESVSYIVNSISQGLEAEYLSGATICLDVDNDNNCTSADINVKLIDSYGNAEQKFNENDVDRGSDIIVVTSNGNVYSYKLDKNSVSLNAQASALNEKSVALAINPMTTLVNKYARDNNLSFDSATEKLAQILGTTGKELNKRLSKDTPSFVFAKSLYSNNHILNAGVLSKVQGAFSKIKTALSNGVTTDAIVTSYKEYADFDHIPSGDDVEKNNKPVITNISNYTSGCHTKHFDAVATDADNDVLSYTWYFDDNKTENKKSVEHSFMNTGRHTAVLEVADKYSKVEQEISFEVNNDMCGAELNAGFVFEKADNSRTVKFTSTSTGSIEKYEWDFGDGEKSAFANPEHTYEADGKYTVSLVVTDADGNKSAAQTQDIYISVNDDPFVPVVNKAISGLTVKLSSGIEDSKWVFSDGTTEEGAEVVHTFEKSGTYTVVLMYSVNGYSKSMNIEIQVQSVDELSAEIRQVSVNSLTVKLEADTVNASANATYSWNMGDGKTENGVAITHSYDEEGEYQVVLTVADGDKKTTAATTVNVKADVINHAPEAGFTFDVDGVTVEFTNTSKDADGDALTYEWDFGDGTSVNDQNPVHTYADKDATYTVSLVAKDKETSNKAVKTVTIKKQDVDVNHPPVAKQNISVNGMVITYKSESTDEDNDSLTCEWDFGDGSKSKECSGTHEYSKDGEYTVTLKVYDGKDYSSVAEKVVKVKDDTVAGDLKVDFKYTFTGLSGSVTPYIVKGKSTNAKYSWDFGDGITSNDKAPSVTYTSGGEKTILLTVTTDSGTATKSYSITLVETNAVVPSKKGIYYKGQADGIYIWTDSEKDLVGIWPGAQMVAASEDSGWSFYDTSALTQTTVNVIFLKGGEKITGDLNNAPVSGCYDGVSWTVADKCVLSGSAPVTQTGGYTGGSDDDDDDDHGDHHGEESEEINSDIPWYKTEGAYLNSTADVSGVESAPYIKPNLNPGSYHSDQTLKLTTEDADRNSVDATIYYTLDNTEPTKNSKVYTGPIELKDTSEDGLGTAYRLRALVVGENGVAQEQHFFWFIKSKNPVPAEATDFRDESIYFVVTARYFDGDEENNYYCRDRFDITDPSWRGDFKGLIEKLDYIKGMGFTAIWITPPVENRSGLDYHGYHAYDWFQPDLRLESPGATYFDFIKAAHAKGIKVVQDVVLNHSSNYGIRGQTYIDKIPTKYYVDAQYGKDGISMGGIYEKNIGDYKSLNRCDNDNPVAPEWHRRVCAGDPDAAKTFTVKFTDDTVPVDGLATTAMSYTNYYWSPAKNQSLPPKWYHAAYTNNWESVEEVQQRSMAGDCVDLTTESENVQNYMNAMVKMYIDMGIDAIRIDTLKHMPRADVMAMTSKWQKYKPGMFVFGEALIKGFGDNTPEQLHPWFYTRTSEAGAEKSGDSGISVLDFSLMSTFRDNVTKGSLNGLADVFNNFDSWYADPTKLVTFFQNHDLTPDNTWSGSGAQHCCENREFSALAYNVLWTVRGIPVMYAGDETGVRIGLPPDLTGNDDLVKDTGRIYLGDSLDNGDPIIGHVTDLNAIRKTSKALRRGKLKVLSGDPLVFERTYGNENAIVAIPSASGATVTVTGATDGSYVDVVTGQAYTVSGGSVSLGNIPGASMRVLVKDYTGQKVTGKSQFLK